MNLKQRTVRLWLIRAAGALMITAATLVGGMGRALADDDDEVVTYGPSACSAIADLPAYAGATCLKHTAELDDGVTETTSRYVTADRASAVRLAFERAFAQHGWTIVKSSHDVEDQEWDYTIAKGLRRIKVEMEAQEPHEGTGTEITIEA